MWNLPILLLAAAGCLLAQAPRYDILIRNARVIDGAGNPWFRASVGIEGDRIAGVGLLLGATATLIIDAGGFVISPGFIDIHSHSRNHIKQHPDAENLLRMGVTTIVEGNDGNSWFPIGNALAGLSMTPIAVNFATFVGQGSVRQQVLQTENRKATPAEIERMRALVRQAMRDGAFGLSTGLFYVPGNFTPIDEVIELAKVAGEMGGMHISHMRDETVHVLDSVKETIRIGQEGGLPTQITHHKIIGVANWGRSVETLKLVEDARARGVDVTLDQYPYTASSTGTAAMFPQWSQEGGAGGLKKRLASPAERAKIKAEVVRRLRDDRGGGNPKNVVMASCGFDHSLDGKSLAQITDAEGHEPSLENAAETAMDIQRKGGCSAIYHAIDEEDLERILKYPFTMIASDGGIVPFGEGVPHPRNYGTFARVLGYYVRERRVMGLEDAVRRMTSLPAERLGLADRGLLRPGMKADLVIFDPETVADQATFAEPHQYAAGFRDVLVNGKPVILDGKLTSDRPGQILYGPGK